MHTSVRPRNVHIKPGPAASKTHDIDCKAIIPTPVLDLGLKHEIRPLHAPLPPRLAPEAHGVVARRRKSALDPSDEISWPVFGPERLALFVGFEVKENRLARRRTRRMHVEGAAENPVVAELQVFVGQGDVADVESLDDYVVAYGAVAGRHEPALEFGGAEHARVATVGDFEPGLYEWIVLACAIDVEVRADYHVWNVPEAINQLPDLARTRICRLRVVVPVEMRLDKMHLVRPDPENRVYKIRLLAPLIVIDHLVANALVARENGVALVLVLRAFHLCRIGRKHGVRRGCPGLVEDRVVFAYTDEVGIYLRNLRPIFGRTLGGLLLPHARLAVVAHREMPDVPLRNAKRLRLSRNPGHRKYSGKSYYKSFHGINGRLSPAPGQSP